MPAVITIILWTLGKIAHVITMSYGNIKAVYSNPGIPRSAKQAAITALLTIFG